MKKSGIMMLVASALLATPQASWACTCGPRAGVIRSWSRASAVFLGIPQGPESQSDPWRHQVRVLESWKGVSTRDTVVVVFSPCPRELRKGHVYLMYASPSPPFLGDSVPRTLSVSICDRTAPVDSAVFDLTILDRWRRVPLR
jgi:hypothetical protein